MFLLEFNCCHKMLRLLKWWNSLRRALFCSCLVLLVIMCEKQHPSLPMVRNLLWSEGLCRNPSPKVEVREMHKSKYPPKKPIKLKNSAFLQLVDQGKQTVVVWPVRSFICQLHHRGPQLFVRNSKTAERFWLQDCSSNFLFKTCLRKREINNVRHWVAAEGFLAAKSPRLQQSERFTSRRSSIEPGWRSARAKAIFGQVAGMEPVECGVEITVLTPKCI